MTVSYFNLFQTLQFKLRIKLILIILIKGARLREGSAERLQQLQQEAAEGPYRSAHQNVLQVGRAADGGKH